MNAILAPAIALMKRMSFRRKFVLLGLMILGAISVVVYNLFASLSHAIHTSQQELEGIALIRPFSQAIQSIQQHRGIWIMYSTDQKVLKPQFAAREHEAVRAFAAVKEKLPADLKRTGEWQSIEASWERLEKEEASQSAADNFAAHTRLIGQIQAFEVAIADQYKLTLDSQIDTYYLIDTAVNKLPDTIEHLGQLRAYGAGILAGKQITDSGKANLHGIIAILRESLAPLDANLGKAIRHTPALRSPLTAVLRDIEGSARQIARLVESDILTGQFATPPEEFYTMASAAIDRSYRQMHESLLPAAEKLLRERIARAESTLRASIGFALLLTLVVAYFATGIYHAAMGSIQALARSSRAFAGGDLRERVRLDTRDELAQVGDSFNGMADGFEAMLAARKQLEESRECAEAERDKQMNALAEANVRMMLFYSAVEELRQINAGIAEAKDYLDLKLLRDAMSLAGAKYGAIGLFDEEGGLTKFLTEGVSEAERLMIGSYPRGEGLLKSFYREKKIARVESIADDPRSCGFPPGHPPMKSLMGVPIVLDGATKGVIYLADKHSGEPFSEQDEMTMSLLAGEMENMLARSKLMLNLRDSNQALMREKAEQQLLIVRLQEAQSQLLQSEKMASIGQLAAGVAHEINNPIGFVYSNLGSLEKYVQDVFGMLDQYEQAEGAIADGEVRDRLRAARKKLDIDFLREDLGALMSESKDGITRVKQIVQNLKDFSHADASDEWHHADLHKGLDSTLNIVHNEIKYKANVVKQYGDLPEVECLPSQLNQVFMNLLVNAAHAIEERGTITLRTGCQGEEVWVDVADTGKGIPPENMKKIFDPFFTTKPVGKGTGLGLSLSYGIIGKHHGRIEVQSEMGKGTTFRVWLPVRQQQEKTVMACADQPIPPDLSRFDSSGHACQGRLKASP